MFGIQWDLVCKFLEVKSDLTVDDINKDSSSWGNYENAKIENIKVGKYAIYSVKFTTNTLKIMSSIILRFNILEMVIYIDKIIEDINK